MTIRNKELDDVVFKKQCKVIEFDRGVIDEETYNKKMKEYDEIAKEIRERLVEDFGKKQKEAEVKKKMEAQENVGKVEEPKKAGRKPKEDSYTMTIVKTLMRKSIKSISEVVDKVDEVKPGRDKKKIQQQVKMIIYLVKNQKGKRWENYSWDEGTFLLTVKE